MIWFFLALIVFVLILIVYASSAQRERDLEEQGDDIDKTFEDLPDFVATKKIIGLQGSYIFGVDENNRKVAFVKNYYKEVAPFDKISSVEILEDNTLIHQKSSMRTIGGAVIGGIVAGGAGAIVGGLSGDSKQKKTVSRVQVKIKLKNINHPSFIIDCFDSKTMTVSGEPVKTDSPLGALYKQGLQDAQRIADTISAIIDLTDKGSKSSSQQTIQSTKVVGSVADELLKLAELKEKGLLTDEEFNSQKKLLLGRSESLTMPSVSQEKDNSEIVVEDDVPSEIIEALTNGQKITAIKLYMNRTGCGLEEAKNYIDSIS